MSSAPTTPIYLDYHATTPCDPRVVTMMLPYFTDGFGNPSSTTHRVGQRAAQAIEAARAQVAELLGAFANEIFFTSGATESNNLAIFGLAHGQPAPDRRRIVTTQIEHKAILAPYKELQKQGYEVVYLPVDETGLVDLAAARQLINAQTLLVSVHAANNEIGTLQPIAALAEIAHEQGAWMHTDAAQAVGKIPIDVAAWGVDLLSLSGHKLYGPKGIGALFVSGGINGVPLKPLLFGGGQEKELRPGTQNVPAIVGLGEACAICHSDLENESVRIAQLRDLLEQSLTTQIPQLQRHGSLAQRLPGNSSLTFPGVDAEALMTHCPELALSTGSACTSGALEPSHVLTAIGLSRELAYSTIRFGLGRFTTADEINSTAKILIHNYYKLKEG